MNGPTTIQESLKATQFLLNEYLKDFTDEEILKRPVPGANHIAWQLGHLIGAEIHLIREQLPEASFPQLPDGFLDKHNKETAGIDDAGSFHSREEYVNLFNQVREATIALVGQLSEADLDRPTTGALAPFAPTLGAMLILVSNHTLMHGGQFTVVRRQLGKPVLF
mgnify:CR=1 FL=1